MAEHERVHCTQRLPRCYWCGYCRRRRAKMLHYISHYAESPHYHRSDGEQRAASSRKTTARSTRDTASGACAGCNAVIYCGTLSAPRTDGDLVVRDRAFGSFCAYGLVQRGGTLRRGRAGAELPAAALLLQCMHLLHLSSARRVASSRLSKNFREPSSRSCAKGDLRGCAYSLVHLAASR